MGGARELGVSKEREGLELMESSELVIEEEAGGV